jgi:hypothetical protein
MSEMEDNRRKFGVFRALVRKILNNPTFAQDLLQGDEGQKKEMLYAFLHVQGEFSEDEKAQALDGLIEVLNSTDLGKINALATMLDDMSVAIPF